jgi:hypothetical protein
MGGTPASVRSGNDRFQYRPLGVPATVMGAEQPLTEQVFYVEFSPLDALPDGRKGWSPGRVSSPYLRRDTVGHLVDENNQFCRLHG